MRGVKTLVLAVVTAGIVGMSAPAFAQEVPPEQLALARKYVDLTDSTGIYETTLLQTGVQTLRQIVQQNPELVDQTNTVIGEVIKEYASQKGDLLDQFARLYAVRFSMEELNEIVTFYESPVGKKLSAANSEMNTDMGRVLQVFQNNLRSEFFAKVRAGLRAQGIEL